MPDLDPDATRRLALHLTPAEAWRSAPPDAPYAAGSLAVEGFIHLTHRADDLIEVANERYRDDRRSQVALLVDLVRLESPWRYDGDARFPQVYGALDRSAIVAVLPVRRDASGRFLAIGEPGAQAGQR